MGLYQPVLPSRWKRHALGSRPDHGRRLVGRTAQAVAEAAIARDLGYKAGLLSLGAMQAPAKTS